MFDFIKSLELSEEIKSNDIYYLFKTDSTEMNLKFLSALQKYETTEKLLNYYTNQDSKLVLDFFDNISSISSKICEDEEKNEFNSEIDQYISGLSKIIFLFLMIQKNNELLSNLLINTKKYLNKFYMDCQIQKYIKEKINSCLNELMCSSIVTSKRNYSRRSTKENTINSLNKFVINNSSNSKQQISNSNEEELFFSQIHTPKFEEDENEIIEELEEPKNNSSGSSGKDNLSFEVIKEAISKRDSTKRFDSSLTLSKMNFIYESELEAEPQLEKTKSHNIENDCLLNNFNRRKSKIKNKKNEIIPIEKNNDILSKNNNEAKQIFANFLDAINCLYKKGKINLQIKLSMKQLIISDSEKIIDKFLNYNGIKNQIIDKNKINENIQTFLLNYFKDLKK